MSRGLLRASLLLLQVGKTLEVEEGVGQVVPRTMVFLAIELSLLVQKSEQLIGLGFIRKVTDCLLIHMLGPVLRVLYLSGAFCPDHRHALDKRIVHQRKGLSRNIGRTSPSFGAEGAGHIKGEKEGA